MANRMVAAAFFSILTAVFLLVYLDLPAFLTVNPTYNMLFGFFPFLFGMLTIIVVFKGD